jgi:hypothetical protein
LKAFFFLCFCAFQQQPRLHLQRRQRRERQRRRAQRRQRDGQRGAYEACQLPLNRRPHRWKNLLGKSYTKYINNKKKKKKTYTKINEFLFNNFFKHFNVFWMF